MEFHQHHTRRWNCTRFATPLPLKGKSRISLLVELPPEQFTVTAARPYVSFVFRNDGYTSDFDLPFRGATRRPSVAAPGDRFGARAGRVDTAVRSAAPHRIRGPAAAGRLCAGARSHRWSRASREVQRLARLGQEPRGRHSRPPARRRSLRHAHGSDTYLSDEIIATISRRDLHENALYRCDRCDDALPARLESLDSTRYGRIPNPPQWYIRELHANACGEFPQLNQPENWSLADRPQEERLLGRARWSSVAA